MSSRMVDQLSLQKAGTSPYAISLFWYDTVTVLSALQSRRICRPLLTRTVRLSRGDITGLRSGQWAEPLGSRDLWKNRIDVAY
ncbi:hypothetical protein E2562_037797 [Oryza meyeriana var. granulata]|uniref:Uncharacterized protein n=1 Tax=Oryza meyeriana var. granulata TaxID=110450 RepID=A0A6G1E859_9ORYZ|nr:hypothetical protein E2562_037797 [Oryza meyeriana var. granulata]